MFIAAVDAHRRFGGTCAVPLETFMRNPWTKKNPFMSMWLSAANTAMGSARGHAVSAVKRQASAVQSEAMRQVIEFWSGGGAVDPPRKRRRKR